MFVCPYCGSTETKIIDTRLTIKNITRRRRECKHCKTRFTTKEVFYKTGKEFIEQTMLEVDTQQNEVTSNVDFMWKDGTTF